MLQHPPETDRAQALPLAKVPDGAIVETIDGRAGIVVYRNRHRGRVTALVCSCTVHTDNRSLVTHFEVTAPGQIKHSYRRIR